MGRYPLAASAIPGHVLSLLFGQAWDEAFGDIIASGRVVTDPSVLVTWPTASDATLAPLGRDLLYALAPAPNLVRRQINPDEQVG